MAEQLSISDHLVRRASRDPSQLALICPAGRITLGELDSHSDSCAQALLEAGLQPGMRVVLMVRPGLEFLIVGFALLKMGAVPVFVDPGMGWKNLKRCLAEAEPEAFIGVPLAQLARVVLGWARTSLRFVFTVGSLPIFGGVSLQKLIDRERSSVRKLQCSGFDQPATIVFTSGSTGTPKGVVYTHRMFARQVALLREEFGIEEGEVDLATFPLFALFDPALGVTTVFPEMDFTRPGQVHPPKIIRPLQEWKITHMFGSPALLDRVGKFAEREGIQLKYLRRVLSAGAPVPDRVLERFQRLLSPGAEVYTPYGATEALPICSISATERLNSKGAEQGRGVCVGPPLLGVHLEVIRISDEALPEWSEDLRVSPGEIGELVVHGENVSAEYYQRPQANFLGKIVAADGQILHRMGDLGYRDEQGRIWFCGRKSQRVITGQQTLYTVCCEGVFNQHSAVKRSALVGIGKIPQRPVICIELEEGIQPTPDLRDEIMAQGQSLELTRPIHDLLFHPSFPVDIRHNAKIFREKLAIWAERKLR